MSATSIDDTRSGGADRQADPEVGGLETSRLLFDYERTQESFEHYEKLSWEIGGLLFAGIFAMIGVSIEKLMVIEFFFFLPYLIILVSWIVLFWFLWFQRNMMLTGLRYKRLLEIEALVAGICQFTVIESDNRELATAKFRDHPGNWIRGYTRHRYLVRLLCLIVPAVLIAAYVCLFVARFGMQVAMIVNCVVCLPPVCCFLLYPMYPRRSVKVRALPGSQDSVNLHNGNGE